MFTEQHVTTEVASPKAGRGRALLGGRMPRLLSGAAIETALIVIVLLGDFLLMPHAVYGDGSRRYAELDELLRNGQISGDKYSLIGPLFSAPLWFLGKLYRGASWWEAHYNLFLFALGLLAIYWILKDRVDRGLVRKFLLLLAAVSMFPYSLTSYYGEPFTALLVGIGLLAAVFGPALWGWIGVVLGVANTPATLLGMGLAALLRIVERRRVRYALAVIAAFGLIALENLIRHHSIANTRYESGFTFPILIGILAILFSFGKGLIFFAPGLLLPIRGRLLPGGEGERNLWRTYVLWMAFLAGMIVVYANWYDWSGDWFWGPRFFLFASIPASLVVAVRLHHRGASLPANLATLGALVLAAWVTISSVLFDLDAVANACGTLSNLSPNCSYQPQTSALWYPLLSPHFNPGFKPIAFSLICFVAFAYLAAPLVSTVLRQTWDALRRAGLTSFAGWRRPTADTL
ncbi:MAG TPA: hypothetical protein VJQ45_06290 [Ktedonobacterales bacterium]|nr:hypothetical protein [Ktedonobacterales bacterium]